MAYDTAPSRPPSPDDGHGSPCVTRKDCDIRHLSAEAFDALLQDAMASLPDDFRQLLDVVPVVVEETPGPLAREVCEDPHELMGLFVGPPIEEWNQTDAPPETAVIYIFQRPLEDSCRDRTELAEQVRITLFHELGHCLGFDEEGLGRIGLE